MFFGINNTQNVDTVIYFDDINVEAFAQPYESVITINTNIGGEVVNIKGKRGEEIKFPTLVHPDVAPFGGYYLDKGFTTPYESTVYERLPVTVYAKWGPYAMSFKEYPFEDDAQKVPNINRESGKGLGNGDDYAMHWYVNRK
jgi:hypothetical protein